LCIASREQCCNGREFQQAAALNPSHDNPSMSSGLGGADNTPALNYKPLTSKSKNYHIQEASWTLLFINLDPTISYLRLAGISRSM
jgi:hypothetical protein